MLARHEGLSSWISGMIARGLTYRAINALTYNMNPMAIMVLAAIAIIIAWNMRHR